MRLWKHKTRSEDLLCPFFEDSLMGPHLEGLAVAKKMISFRLLKNAQMQGSRNPEE